MTVPLNTASRVNMNVRTAFMMTIAVSTPLCDVARWLELLGSRSKKHMTTAAGVGHTHTHAHNGTHACSGSYAHMNTCAHTYTREHRVTAVYQ